MVSQKEKSNQADTQKSALLVIDVQNDLFEKKILFTTRILC
jgi:hypothetical protein